MTLYLDASAIIYTVESTGNNHNAVEARINEVDRSPTGIVLTSRLSRLECRVAPLRDGKDKLLALYEEWFTRRSVQLCEIDGEVIERATDVRAKFGLKTPDAIHIATAIRHHADVL